MYNEGGVSPNPMDPNWGGEDYTQELVDSGYYADDEVNRKDVSLTKTQRPYNISPELGGLEASTDEELSVDDLVS